MVEIAVLVVTFLFIVALGTPLVVRASRASFRRRAYVGTYDPETRIPIAAGTRLTPIDLGPSELQWPSDKYDDFYEEKLSWPSASWNDASFGANAASMAAENARRAAETKRRQALEGQRAAGSGHAPPAFSAKASAPTPEAFAQSAPRRARAAPATPPTPRPRAEAPARPPRKAATPPPAPEPTPTAVPPPSGQPTPEQVAALVRERGLADAVAYLRRTTDLDIDEITALLLRASS